MEKSSGLKKAGLMIEILGFQTLDLRLEDLRLF